MSRTKANGGWEPYLKAGEKVLWTGAPAKGFRFSAPSLMRTAMGVIFLIIALTVFHPVLTRVLNGDAHFNITVLVPIIFVATGLHSVFGQHIWSMWVRSRTRYALTDERAMIATRTFGKSMKSYPITPVTSVEFEDRSEGSVYFATKSVRRNRKSHEQRIGFEYISDAGDVYKLITKMQTKVD